MLSCILRLTASTNYFVLFALKFLLGLVKCLAEFLLRLSVKTGKTTAEKMTAKPSSK